MKNARRTSLALLSLVTGIGIALVGAQSLRAAEKEAERHMVFAHYMVCFANSVEFYKQEIQLAQQHGIDGFALNCGGWGTVDPKTREFKPGNYVTSAQNIYEAARQLSAAAPDRPAFKLFISADLATLGDLDANIPDMVKRFYKHPNQFRYQGKAVMSGYAGTPESYAGPINSVRKEGYDVCLVPFVSSTRYEMAWSTEAVMRLFEGQPHMDGLLRFAADDLPWGTMWTNTTARRVTQHLGKVYIAGISPTYVSANVRDNQGMRGYGAIWEGIIRDDADWVEIVTWNDYNEDSNLMPYKWKRMWDKPAFNRDGAYLDVTAYYSAWYKSGVRPTIKQDKVFFAYRDRPRGLRKAWDPKKQEWVDITLVPWPYDQIHDDVRDCVYVTTFLTAPAQLGIGIGDTGEAMNMPAGVAHAELPMRAGVPHFTLCRSPKPTAPLFILADVVGRRSIVTEATKENSTNIGHHILSRIWAGGAAVGPRTRLEAALGEIHGGAAVVQEKDMKAVKNEEKDGSGFTLRVKGLDDAMYNVQVVYRNTTAQDARLTLIADGPPRSDEPEDKSPYYIPVWFPPTGDQWQHASFFWPLYKRTSFLTLQWMAGRSDGTPDKPEWDDKGSVLVNAIELVKVEPMQVPQRVDPKFPEMVAIPGGTFVMGSKDGEPDEQPVHKVTLSPFAISRHEVTNEQFEMFDPGHRRFRDEFSWRNREPVIYVSWRDAARYCNWLSAQAGLTPVYDEKTWETNLKADGVRLPTEAEWEYVASGRGEGRKYPWGNDAPKPGVHGNLAGEASLEVNPNTRSLEGAGTMVVGTYPAGASRDGVMDLSGNAAEWCSDYYGLYGADEQTDPMCRTQGTHCVIRGGSWGYYGWSQRAADREFNNPGYGGYIYVGFRLAISEPGRKRLEKK